MKKKFIIAGIVILIALLLMVAVNDIKFKIAIICIASILVSLITKNIDA